MLTWMETYTGKMLRLADPRVEDIDIMDIAHGLSQLCRYAGQCRKFYSVAQHSYLVSKLVTPKNALQALMHDAMEAYLVDLPVGLKNLIPEYREFEKMFMRIIFKRFNIPLPLDGEVKYWDTAILTVEKRKLFPFSKHKWGVESGDYIVPDIPIYLWDARTAETMFMSEFRLLRERQWANIRKEKEQASGPEGDTIEYTGDIGIEV